MRSSVSHAFLSFRISVSRTEGPLTVQTFPVRTLATVVPLVKIVIRTRVVINRIAHVHVPGVPIAELAIVPLGPVRRSVRSVIEGPANDIGNLRALSNRLCKQTPSDHS